MAGNDENNTDQNYDGQPFSLGPILQPIAYGAAKANPELFAKLPGGGVGMSSDNTAASPGTVPAAVSKTGSPTISQQATQRAYEQMAALPNVGDELAQEKALEEKRAQDAAYINPRDAQGKVLPEYKASVWDKIRRGLEGFQRGGIIGAATAPYGAPGPKYQRAVDQQTKTVAADDQSLQEMARRFKESQQAAIGNAKELTGIAAEDRANRPTAEKTEQVIDRKTGAVRYLSPEEINAGDYQSPATYNKEDSPDKTQAVINAKTGGLEFRTAAEINNAPGKYRSVSTQNLIIREGDKGEKKIGVTNTQTGNLEYHTEEEINGNPGKYQLASGRGKGPAYTESRPAFELHWSKQLGPGTPLEKKYDAQRKAVAADTDLSDSDKQAKYTAIEAEREAEKAKLQQEKDAEAEQYGVYNQQRPNAPAQAAPRTAPATQNRNQPQGKPLDQNTARAILKEAGGDKNKARQLAKQRGYSF